MGRDTIQLENNVSTISQEYLLEFTSEYGIPESLHPELPAPEDPIVEFPEGKVGVYTMFFEFANFHMDLFSLISAPNPAKVKIKTRPRAAHEVPLLIATANRVIDMEDMTGASGSSGTPSTGVAPVGNPPYTEVAPEPDIEKETVDIGALVSKKRRKRGPDEVEANASLTFKATFHSRRISNRYDGRSTYYGGIATYTHRGICRGNCGLPNLAKQFELKHSLINMMTSDQFELNKITFTIKYKDVPNSAIQLILFPFSLTGAVRRTTNLRNEISNFQQRFDGSFHEAWDRYKDLLRACPHHCFTELHQLDTFYNALNPTDQDSLNSAAGGNLLERRTQDVLTIIENKSKQTSAVTTAMAAILKEFQATPPPASVKAVEEICVTCGGAHPYYQCLVAGGNTFPELRDNIQGYVAGVAVNYNQGNSVYRPPGSGSLPSNTIANPKGKLKSITTRSGIVLDRPFKMLKALLYNKEKLQELVNTPLNENCSVVILKKLPEKLGDPMKFLILCGFKSINLINVFNDSNEDFLEDLFTTNQPSGNPSSSSHLILTSSEVKDDIFDPEGGNVLPEKFLDLDSTKDLYSPLHVNSLSGSTTSSSSLNQLLEDLADELALITFPSEYDDGLQFVIESDLKEIEYLLHHDPIKDLDSILKDSIDQSNLVDLNNNHVDSMPEMFTDEYALDYSSPPLFYEYDDDLFKVESDTKNVYDDPFDSKGEKIKESKLLIDELDLRYRKYLFE
nr:hypothetical protein [Tanacetum cinerariifolium]